MYKKMFLHAFLYLKNSFLCFSKKARQIIIVFNLSLKTITFKKTSSKIVYETVSAFCLLNIPFIINSQFIQFFYYYINIIVYKLIIIPVNFSVI